MAEPCADVTANHADEVFAKIRGGRWRADPQAKAWIGYAVGEVLRLDPSEPQGKARIKAAIKMWRASGRLKIVIAKDDKGMDKEFIEVAPPIC